MRTRETTDLTSDRHVDVIFDGQCAFCVRSLALVRRLARRDVFRFYDANRRTALLSRFPMLANADLDEAMFVVTPAGEVSRGFFAFRSLMRASPWLYPFLVLFYAMKRIVQSPLGLILQSIRENPARAAAVGYDVKRYKWIAFTIAGAFTGLAGVLYSMMFGIVPLEVISWVTSGDIVFMVLIGGIGHLYGPLIGAAAFKWLSEAVSVLWERWPLILGVALVLVVLFLRGGLVEALARLRLALARRRLAADAGAESA